MFTVKATKYNLGVEISGSEEDLWVLYEGISRLCNIDVDQYEGVQNRLLAFLYELRNTSQGEREVQMIEKELPLSKQKERPKLKTVYEISYRNRFLWTEILFVIFALEDYKTMCLQDPKHFVTEDKMLQPIYASCHAQCEKDMGLVSYFQQCCWEALTDSIGEIRTKSLKKLLRDRKMNYRGYCTQAIDFMNKRLIQAFVENRSKVVGELARNMIKKDGGYDELEASIKKFARENGIAYYLVDYEGNEIQNFDSLAW